MDFLIKISISAIIVVVAFSFFFLLKISNKYKEYKVLPKYILFKKDKEKYEELPVGIADIQWSAEILKEPPIGRASYTLTVMPFKKWKQLFELNPKAFIFVFRGGLVANSKYPTKQDYRASHPCYVSKKNKTQKSYQVIEFGFLDYIQYYFYKNGIIKTLCFLDEQEISMAIVGDIREKIDRIAEEANRDVQRTLDLQKDIMLCLSDEEAERGAENP